MNKFKELKVWQLAVDLAAEVYTVTKSFPGDERFGLASQMNRSSVSIASNIAEGAGRNSKGEFVQFLGIAAGSAFELETQLHIADKLGYIKLNEAQNLLSELQEIQRMLGGLKKSLAVRKAQPTTNY